MKALSLWQPWASLWLSPAKIHETRDWRMNVPDGGVWIAVHAAKRMTSYIEPELRAILEREFGPVWPTKLARGAIIGAVRVVECVPTENIVFGQTTTGDDLVCGNFAARRFGFRRDAYIQLENPLPCKGKQGWFTVDDDLIRENLAPVGALQMWPAQ